MAIVEIKGVGQAQFPDDMSVDNIRSFLRKKYAQNIMTGESSILQPIENTASPYQPSFTERLGQGVSDVLYDTGIISDRYGAQRIGGNIATMGEFLPGVGDAAAGDEFGSAVAKGDYSGMAMAGLGIIPVAGDALKKGYRGISSANKRIDPNITWFSADEKLAKGYSDKNEAFSRDLNIKSAFDAGDDKNTTTPRKFANKALQQKGSQKIDKETAMLIRDDFLENYPNPDKEVSVLDFWSSDDGKENVANMLEDLGFDAVRLKEEGVETYGMVRMIDKQSALPMDKAKKITNYEGDYPLDDFDNWWGDRTYKAQGAEMFEMSPDEYLAQVKPLKMDEETLENVDDLVDHMQSGRKLDPLVIYADGKEDGRHRALAAKKLGFGTVPVIDYRSK